MGCGYSRMTACGAGAEDAGVWSDYPPRLSVIADIRVWRPSVNCGLVHRSKNRSLLDHLVGAGEERRRHRETERICGLEVND